MRLVVIFSIINILTYFQQHCALPVKMHPIFYQFSSNVWMDGMTRAHPKQCLLRRPWSLPSHRAIPGYWESLTRIENLPCPSKPDTARPTQLTSTGRGCSHQPGHPSQEFHISSAGASRTRALTTGSLAPYQLSYGTGLRRDGHEL